MNILRFKNRATEDIYHCLESKAARNLLPVELHSKAARLIDRLCAASSVLDLQSSPGMRVEKLRGVRSGQYSMRVNDQYRICFALEDGNAIDVEITDYH